MKISYARLRSGVNYKGPLETVIDSFCELHKMFIEQNILSLDMVYIILVSIKQTEEN